MIVFVGSLPYRGVTALRIHSGKVWIDQEHKDGTPLPPLSFHLESIEGTTGLFVYEENEEGFADVR